jgi:formamidopyrimidine-DNA glycosylase
MPELPEVEVLRLSLAPRLVGERIDRVRVWNAALREPVNARQLARRVSGRRVERLRRRAKYLLIDVEGGSTLIVHLGMSGRFTLVPEAEPRQLHEHVAFFLASGKRVRFRDPRRFGLVLAAPTEGLSGDRHFRHLGVEPLGEDFSGARLAAGARGRRAPVKSFLLDGRIVVGVGNIYASEALHRAAIHPRRAAGRISKARWSTLADSVRGVLSSAIEQGGTTLNDFTNGQGEPGYFQVALSVYDREGKSCARCGGTIRRIVQSNRSTFYCPGCQR